MKRISVCTGLVLGALTLSACAADTADSAQVQQWMTDQQRTAGGELGLMTALAFQASDIADQTVDGLGEQIRMDFDEPVRIADVEFTCFGAETMDVSVYTEADGHHIGTGAVDVRCDDGPVTVDLGIGDKPASSVSVIGANAVGAGAWSVVVR